MLSCSRLLILSVVAATVCVSFQPVQAEDEVVGIIWEIGRKMKDGKVKWEAVFRAAPNGKIWTVSKTKAPEVVGHWSGTEENTKATVFPSKHHELRKFIGDYEFVLVGKKPKIWEGTFTHKSGIEVPIIIRLIQD